MNTISFKNEFIEAIKEAVENYSFDHGDFDFSVSVKIESKLQTLEEQTITIKLI